VKHLRLNRLGRNANLVYPTLMTLPVARTIAELQATLAAWRENGDKIALVPTMGALHAGHLSHLTVARTRATRVVVSIFVNPAQFAPHEDFDRYPRNLESDAEKLSVAGGADLIYAPSPREMYPDGVTSKPVTDGPAAGLETDFRPHFFGGVVTVVEKLFRQVTPDFATFGEKDYQQLLVVTRLAEQMKTGIEILPVPILREEDGLALSSRNAYLTQEERKVAPALYRTLQAVAARAKHASDMAQAEAEGAAQLLSVGFDRVDYCTVRDAESLRPLRAISAPARVLAAAWLGKTRLIDNVAVSLVS
jgi:pantoate--beta-alanine ligase